MLDRERKAEAINGSPRKTWFLRLARGYVRRRLASDFDSIQVRGLDRARELCAERPVIVASNHVAWWDAFLTVLLDQELGSDGFCLMDSDNLERLPFFLWLGAIPLDRSHPRNSLRDLEASSRLLDRPGRAVWIFPQGQQRPFHLRPLDLQKGVAYLAEKSRAPVLPLSISYLYFQAPRPRIVLSLGEALDRFAGRAAFMTELESRLVQGLETNDGYFLEGNTEYESLLASTADGSDTPAGARLLSALGDLGNPREKDERYLRPGPVRAAIERGRP
jgi:1-acyl-sn-glycerol-3-phosphate acyltransferase